jgi:hypothetical protein
MSIPFSSTTNKNGIIQQIERECGFDDGTITGNSTLMAQFTADVNMTLDEAWSIILPASGLWQLDDSNHTDYPIITTNLVSGQRDYSFTTDGSGNYILDIYKVMCRVSETGEFRELTPIDQQSVNNDSINNGLDQTGTPTKYDKTGNGIFLDYIPNYSSTGGLKIHINREASYFTVADTSKKAGFAGIFHQYLYLKPAYKYARAKGLQSVERLKRDIMEVENAMKSYYAQRERDVRKRMTANVENTK